MQNSEIRKLVLPALRADVEMHEKYLSGRSGPLPVPIRSLRGRYDQLVTTDQAAEWAKATSREFELREVPGSHMYVMHGTHDVLRVACDAAMQLRNAPGRRHQSGEGVIRCALPARRLWSRVRQGGSAVLA
jgi:surfactin synthase thioesterase subunit